MASANFELEIQNSEGVQGSQEPLIRHYRPSEVLPEPLPPLHQLMKKSPSTWAVVQTCIGILNLSVGIVYAVSFKINDLLLTLFRVPILTGVLFMFTGVLVNLLYKHSGLLQICLLANACNVITSAIGVILLSVDLHRTTTSEISYKVEILVLCITLLDVFIAGVLIFWIGQEKRRLKP